MGSSPSTVTTPSDYHRQRSDVESSHVQIASGRARDTDEQEVRTGEGPQASRKYSRSDSKTPYASEEIIAALQTELERVEKEHDMYKDKYNKLKEMYRTLKTLAVEHKADLDFHKNEDELKMALLNKILNKHLIPYVEKNGSAPKDWMLESVPLVLDRMFRDAMRASSSRDQVSLLQDQVKSSQDEVESLQGQVQILQKQLLVKTDKVQATSDQQFALDFRNMISLVKTLGRTARPLEIKQPMGIVEEDLLLVGVSDDHWGTRTKAKCLIEACIWSVLVKHVFGTPFTFLGRECDILSSNWQKVFSNGHFEQWPVPSTLCETWRYTTMERMKQIVNLEVITKGVEKGSGSDPVVQKSILQARKTVEQKIQATLALKGMSPDLTQLHDIIDKAFALAMQMSFQRYRIQVTWPKIGEVFNESQMSALPNADGTDGEEGFVVFVVNPGLTKWGDTHGGHFDQRYDVVCSLVQLESGTPVHSKPQTKGEQQLMEAQEFRRELDKAFV